MKREKISIYTLLGLLLAVILVLTPNMPFLIGLFNRDSGVFLYMAEQILAGHIPYRDIWDHKGPAIYYIDAFGLFIGRGSLWGVWFVQFLSLYAAALLGHLVMSRAYGKWPAMIGTMTWLSALSYLLRKGNLTEEFTLPLSFAAIFIFWLMESKGKSFWGELLIGITFALSFLLRANNIGTQISILLFYVLSALWQRNWKAEFLRVSVICFTFMATLVLVLLYFVLNDAWLEFYDAAFRYNYIYSESDLSSKVQSLYAGINLLTGIAVIASISWACGLFYVRYRAHIFNKSIALFSLALIGFPVEVLMSSISGRAFEHYYMNWLPMSALLVSGFVFILLEDDEIIGAGLNKKRKQTALIWLLAVFFMINLYPIKQTYLSVHHANTKEKKVLYSFTEYILTHTRERDYLLMWGAEPKFNVLTKRRSPTRFFYQYPLYTKNYHTKEMVLEFLNDLATKTPLIIDSSPTNKKVPPIDVRMREKWEHNAYENWDLLPEMSLVFEFIDQNYQIVETVGPEEWPVYRYVGSQP